MTRAAAVAAALGVAAGSGGVARADEVAAAPAATDLDDDEIVPDRRARRAAAEANLEPERNREGLALGVGVGPSTQIGFGISGASGIGPSLDLRIGTSATERFAWFVDLFTAGTPPPNDGGSQPYNQSLILTGGAQLYVLEALWLRAGVGVSRLDIGGTVEITHGGLGLLGGGGVDFLRRGRFAMSGALTFAAGVYRDGVVPAAIFHLGFTWY